MSLSESISAFSEAEFRSGVGAERLPDGRILVEVAWDGEVLGCPFPADVARSWAKDILGMEADVRNPKE